MESFWELEPSKVSGSLTFGLARDFGCIAWVRLVIALMRSSLSFRSFPGFPLLPALPPFPLSSSGSSGSSPLPPGPPLPEGPGRLGVWNCSSSGGSPGFLLLRVGVWRGPKSQGLEARVPAIVPVCDMKEDIAEKMLGEGWNSEYTVTFRVPGVRKQRKPN